jgi:hypothetical protein
VNTTTEQRYRKALHICSANLSGAQDADPKESALCFFRMGVVLGRMGDIGGAIRCFNDAFILRDMTGEQGRSNLWRQFHDIQMAIYILGKRNKTLISLAEGDMVHDLIKYRWRLLQSELANSEIPFAGNDMKAWFRTVKIDFPWEMEDMDGLFGSPDDQESFIDPLECVKITR